MTELTTAKDCVRYGPDTSKLHADFYVRSQNGEEEEKLDKEFSKKFAKVVKTYQGKWLKGVLRDRQGKKEWAVLSEEEGKQDWILSPWFFFEVPNGQLRPGRLNATTYDDSSYLADVEHVFTLCETGNAVCAAFSSAGANLNLLYGVTKEKRLSGIVRSALSMNEGRAVGVSPLVLEGVIKGHIDSVVIAAAAEGQMLRCFSLATSHDHRLLFFELWFCVMVRLVPRQKLKQVFFDVYAEVLGQFKPREGGHMMDCNGEDSMREKALARLPRLMAEVREGADVKLFRAVCPSRQWNVFEHQGPIESSCVVSYGKHGSCMHTPGATGMALTDQYEKITGVRAWWHDRIQRKEG